MNFEYELESEFEEYDSNPQDSILSASEMTSLVTSLYETQAYLQCYACRPGMVCEDSLEALPGLMVDTVEATPGYWNNNEAFFNSRGEESWGTDLSFERCIGMTRDSSSSDLVSSCGGGLSWDECANEHQTGPMCAVCPSTGGLLDPDYTETLSGRCVDCNSAVQGSKFFISSLIMSLSLKSITPTTNTGTAYIRGTVLFVTLVLVITGIVCFDRFVRMLDRALETGTLAPGSRVARLLRLRRQYKETKKGKRRRSTFSVVSMTKDTTTTTTTTSAVQNQDDGMTTSSGDSTSPRRENLQVSTNNDEISTKENSDDEDLSPRSRWKKRREMMYDDVVQPPIIKKQQEKEATTSNNAGLERDWLDGDDDDGDDVESDTSVDSDDSTVEKGAAYGHTKSMRMFGVKKVHKWQRTIENQILEHQKNNTDDSNVYYFADAPDKPHLWVKLKMLISFIQLVIVIQECVLVRSVRARSARISSLSLTSNGNSLLRITHKTKPTIFFYSTHRYNGQFRG